MYLPMITISLQQQIRETNASNKQEAFLLSNTNAKANAEMTTNSYYFFKKFQDQLGSFKHTDKKDQFPYQEPQT